jgi:signal peptidase II
MLRWLWLSLGVILLDQVTKQLAEAMLTAYQAVAVLPFFDLTLMYNKGAAFSFLSDHSGWQRWFFVILALGVSAGLGVWLKRLRADEKWVAIALALIIGGALGNVIDRILFGQVIDFLDFYYLADGCLPGFARVAGACHWPAFNLADSAISAGVAIMLFDAFVLSTKRQSHKQHDQTES